MNLISVNDIKPKEVVPGFHGRFIHSANMTIAYWDIKAGHSVPLHHHVHEMIVNVISGKLALTVDGETKVLEPGMVVVIPSNVPHTATGVTDCSIIDVFSPVRSDYNNDK
jgi:quercetin dioxygenase-like cupin family protein